MGCHAVIVAGLGFRAAVGLDSLRAALILACDGKTPGLLATAAGKEDSIALMALAGEMGLEICAVPPDQLRAQVTVTSSQASISAYGTGSVAEAAALAAAGAGARLTGPRKISADRMASCAIAEGDGQ